MLDVAFAMDSELEVLRLFDCELVEKYVLRDLADITWSVYEVAVLRVLGENTVFSRLIEAEAVTTDINEHFLIGTLVYQVLAVQLNIWIVTDAEIDIIRCGLLTPTKDYSDLLIVVCFVSQISGILLEDLMLIAVDLTIESMFFEPVGLVGIFRRPCLARGYPG